MALEIKPGTEVIYQQKKYRIKAPISLDSVMLAGLDSEQSMIANISDLIPVTETNQLKLKDDITQVSAEEWAKIKHLEEIIKPLANKSICTQKDAQEAGFQLGLTERQVYNLISRYRKSNGKILSLSLVRFRGGKGKGRLNPEIEMIINQTIDELYLTTQQNKISRVIEEVFLKCSRANLKPPSDRSIRRRIAELDSKFKVTKRRGIKEAFDKFSDLKGSFPEAQYPLSIIQMDHSPVDLIIVDEEHRLPIGRPYLTIAIDVYSRCIPGFYLTLEKPSSISVAMCLLHSVFDKDDLILDKKIEGTWPIWGKPDCIYVDNAAEFHSEALQRGCEAHGMKLDYRPIKKAHYGGIIERLIGTLMQLIHGLPGTTFSNVKEKGQYNSEKKAILTLSELEKWLTVAIVNYYHQKVHGGLNMPPIKKYELGILGDELNKGRGYPLRIQNKKEFLIDFLPIERRTLQRKGFVLDHIEYYNNSLSPLIANRDKYGKFLIRRDPRDLSRIYVLDPNSNNFLEIPCRTLSRPTISLWEHRDAVKYLRNQGVQERDETIIFKAIEKLRQITEEARSKTKNARRKFERNKKLRAQTDLVKDNVIAENEIPKKEKSNKKIDRYEEIELW